jgi:hypothetical protein
MQLRDNWEQKKRLRDETCWSIRMRPRTPAHLQHVNISKFAAGKNKVGRIDAILTKWSPTKRFRGPIDLFVLLAVSS